MNQQDITQLQSLVAGANKVVSFLGENPSYDAVCGATAFHLSLVKAGRKSDLVCGTELTVEYGSIFGVDEVKNKLEGGKNLVISLDYQDGAIDKVSYNAEGGKFNLVIIPKGEVQLSTDKISYSKTGFDADLVFVFGVRKLDELGVIYNQNRALFSERPVILITNLTDAEKLGKLNFINPTAPSVCEMVVSLLKVGNLAPDQDISTNLYQGIMKATESLQSERVNAVTLEAVAATLRAGARKIRDQRSEIRDQKLAQNLKTQESDQIKTEENILTGTDQPKTTNVYSSEATAVAAAANPPADWLKPRIYSTKNT